MISRPLQRLEPKLKRVELVVGLVDLLHRLLDPLELAVGNLERVVDVVDDAAGEAQRKEHDRSEACDTLHA